MQAVSKLIDHLRDVDLISWPDPEGSGRQPVTITGVGIRIVREQLAPDYHAAARFLFAGLSPTDKAELCATLHKLLFGTAPLSDKLHQPPGDKQLVVGVALRVEGLGKLDPCHVAAVHRSYKMARHFASADEVLLLGLLEAGSLDRASLTKQLKSMRTSARSKLRKFLDQLGGRSAPKREAEFCFPWLPDMAAAWAAGLDVIAMAKRVIASEEYRQRLQEIGRNRNLE